MSLRTRITLLTAGLLGLALLGLGLALRGLLSGYLYGSLRQDLIQAADQTARLLALGGQAFLEAGLPPRLYAELQLIPEENPALLAQEGGLSLQRSPALGSGHLILSEEAYARLLQGQEVWTRMALPQGTGEAELLVYARPVVLSLGGSQWKGLLAVGRPTREVEAFLGQVTRVYLGAALLVFLLGSFLAQRLLARALDPLEWLAQKAEAMDQSPRPLPEPEGPEEVLSLVRALNRMLSRMEEAFKTQTRFLQDASHELRTPVTAILGHVGYLLRRTPLTEAQRESLEVIKREAERMGKLVSDLLELSQSGTWRIEPRPVRVLDMLEEVREEFTRGYSGTILVEAPEDLYVLADPDRIHQVLVNLVTNAIKAQARTLWLRAFGVEGRVVFRVEDDGEGIPKEHLPHLFERFYRVDKARDRARGGSGLGLAIVKAILEAHGGEIWVESEPGQGTAFSFALPSSAPPPPPA